jgi:ABC-type uncharacterized transport system permease subunit
MCMENGLISGTCYVQVILRQDYQKRSIFVIMFTLMNTCNILVGVGWRGRPIWKLITLGNVKLS